MTALVSALSSTFIISLIGFAGILTFVFKEKFLNKILIYLVALSAGTLLGGAFLHLIPEATEKTAGLNPFLYVIAGIIAFFILEKVLHWRHCHDGQHCEVHPFTYMNLIGDGIHNLLDGMIIYSAFATSTALGIATTIAVVLHEFPQELGDFGVLVYGGFSKAKALFMNFATAAVAILGVFVAHFASNVFENLDLLLVPIAAGGFVYIAMSDLMPELHKEVKITNSILQFLAFGTGIVFMYFIKMSFEG